MDTGRLTGPNLPGPMSVCGRSITSPAHSSEPPGLADPGNLAGHGAPKGDLDLARQTSQPSGSEPGPPNPTVT